MESQAFLLSSYMWVLSHFSRHLRERRWLLPHFSCLITSEKQIHDRLLSLPEYIVLDGFNYTLGLKHPVVITCGIPRVFSSCTVYEHFSQIPKEPPPPMARFPLFTDFFSSDSENVVKMYPVLRSIHTPYRVVLQPVPGTPYPVPCTPGENTTWGVPLYPRYSAFAPGIWQICL
jgi:hypothetical protein